jgi:deoxyribodipyrimidine photo-lyase
MDRRVATAVCWFRRDLRLRDHRALRAAVRAADEVVPLFVLDPRLLRSARMSPARLCYLADALADLDGSLRARGARLVVRRGDPRAVVPAVAREAGARGVHWHGDHTPYAARRDHAVTAALAAERIATGVHDGTLVHAPGTVRTGDGGPYKVFTPFARAWRALGVDRPAPAPATLRSPDVAGEAPPTLHDFGQSPSDRALDGGERAALARLDRFVRGHAGAYAQQRDVLAAGGTSRLSADLHFGTISPRTIWARLRDSEGHRAFGEQLVWREFYAHVLAEWPEAAHTEWDPASRELPWLGDGPELEAWRRGLTGFPLVDAGMRQLASESWMHNRARMVVASFLCKDLLADWRLGEAHFMAHLVDGDLANNNGGWQWAAGTGTDAQPYFRVFNPARQGARFDPSGAYVRRHVPELRAVGDRWIHEPWRMPPAEQRAAGVEIGRDYPGPIVEHAEAARRARDWYAVHRRPPSRALGRP